MGECLQLTWRLWERVGRASKPRYLHFSGGFLLESKTRKAGNCRISIARRLHIRPKLQSVSRPHYTAESHRRALESPWTGSKAQGRKTAGMMCIQVSASRRCRYIEFQDIGRKARSGQMQDQQPILVVGLDVHNVHVCRSSTPRYWPPRTKFTCKSEYLR